MPKGRKRRWHVLRESDTGRYYVVGPGQQRLSAHDTSIDHFDNEDDARAYADEANSIEQEQSKEQGNVSATQLSADDAEYDTLGGNATPRSGGIPQVGRTLPVPGLSTQAGSHGLGSVQPTDTATAEIWHGRPVQSLPQEIANAIDQAGAGYDTVVSTVSANLSRIVGNCRQGIGKCTSHIQHILDPVIQDAKDRLQLIKDTVSQHAANQLMAAMSNAAVVRDAAGLRYDYSGQGSAARQLVPGAIGTGPVVALPPAGTAPPGGPITGPGPIAPIGSPAPIPDGWALWSNGEYCYCRRAGDLNQPQGDLVVGYYPTFEACSAARDGCAGNPPPPIQQPPAQPPAAPIINNPPPGAIIQNPVEPFPTVPPPAGGWFIGIGGYYYYYPPITNNQQDCCPLGYNLVTMPGGNTLCFPGPGASRPTGAGPGPVVPSPSYCNPGYYGPYPSPQFPPNPGPPSPTPPPPPPPTIGSPPPTIGSPPPNCCPPPVTNVYCAPGTSPTTQPPTIGGPPPIGPLPPGTIVSTPPGPPTITPVGGTVPVVGPVSRHGQYCDNVQLLKDVFVRIGELFFTGMKFNRVTIRGVQQIIGNSSDWLLSNLINVFDHISDSGVYNGIFDSMVSAANSYRFASTADYLHLLACRRVFQWVEALSADAGFNAVGESKTSGSAAPNFFGIGGGAEWNSSWVGTQAIKGAVQLGIVPLLKTLDRCIAFSCPEEIPGIPDAINLYLTNQITIEHCRCLILFNGGVWEEFELSIQAARSRVDGLQTVMLWMRGKITEAEARAKVRELGYIKESDWGELTELAKWIPGPSDLITFMVRDVADEGVATKYELDDDFGKKYVGLLAQLGKAQGIDPSIFKYAWRAHWKWPSNTELYTMIHRLRPDNRPEGRTEKDWDVTASFAKEVLGINDEIPAFRQRLIDISYHPLTRVDARRAFNIGSLSDDEMLSAIKDQGYDDKNAKRLLKFSKLLRDQSVRSNRHVKQYIAGGINADQLTQRLQDDGLPEELANKALDFGNKELRTAGRIACVKALRKRYQLGEFDKKSITQALITVGMSTDQAESFADIFDCERMSRAKQLTGAALCKYVEHGLISVQDMGERLLRMGYSTQDAGIIIDECSINVAQRQAKAAEALARKTAAEQEKIAKAREKLLRDLENARKAQLKARESVQKAADRQQSAFTRAALKMSHIRGISAADAGAQMESAAIFGANSGGISAEEATRLSIDVASSWKARESRPFAVAYEDALRAYRDAIDLSPRNGAVE